MDAVHKLEDSLAKVYQGLPHLPKGGRDWLAQNVWWIAIVGIVISALAALGAISAMFFASAIITGVTVAYGSTSVATAGGTAMLTGWLSLALFAVEIILLAKAVTPLKNHRKQGWTLLFLLQIVALAYSIVVAVVQYNIPGLLMSVIFAGIGAYFLFEIRSYFGAATTKPVDQPPVGPNVA